MFFYYLYSSIHVYVICAKMPMPGVQKRIHPIEIARGVDGCRLIDLEADRSLAGFRSVASRTIQLPCHANYKQPKIGFCVPASQRRWRYASVCGERDRCAEIQISALWFCWLLCGVFGHRTTRSSRQKNIDKFFLAHRGHISLVNAVFCYWHPSSRRTRGFCGCTYYIPPNNDLIY